MNNAYPIVVCAGIVPDPLQTLEPITTPTGPALKNEMMLPAVLDPWSGHALYEAANLAAHFPGSKVWLVSAAPKAKLQQVMMNVAQKVSFELVAVDALANGFADAHSVAKILSESVQSIAGLDRSRLLLFGGWESASRGARATAGSSAAPGTARATSPPTGRRRTRARSRPAGGHPCARETGNRCTGAPDLDGLAVSPMTSVGNT